MSTRLERSVIDRRISGVCGGIGEYLQIDSTLVRIFFVIATIFTGGLFFLVYVAALLLMPLPGGHIPPSAAPTTTETSSGEPATAETTTGEAATAETTRLAPPSAPVSTPVDPETAERRRAMIGYFLIALGAVFLLGNVGLFRIVRWELVWPLVLVGVGVLLLVQRARR